VGDAFNNDLLIAGKSESELAVVVKSLSKNVMEKDQEIGVLKEQLLSKNFDAINMQKSGSDKARSMTDLKFGQSPSKMEAELKRKNEQLSEMYAKLQAAEEEVDKLKTELEGQKLVLQDELRYVSNGLSDLYGLCRTKEEDNVFLIKRMNTLESEKLNLLTKQQDVFKTNV
jgi:hypothetical protein